jgi:hypothetical protein
MGRRYLFLLDRDVSKALSFFPRKRTLTITDVGLAENAKDAEVVRKAWEMECIIVTANGEEFKREILRFQSRTQRKDCRELRGLLVLPIAYERQKRLLKCAETQLRFGGKNLTWREVRDGNYYVKLNDSGRPTVWRFPRCFYCQKLEVGQRP